MRRAYGEDERIMDIDLCLPRMSRYADTDNSMLDIIAWEKIPASRVICLLAWTTIMLMLPKISRSFTKSASDLWLGRADM